MQGNAQQRACAYNVVLRRIFVKVLERAERSWHFLYLIKNQEGVVGINFSAGIQFQPHDQTLCVQIRGKQFGHSGIGIEVDIYGIGIIELSEFLHQPGFPDLPCALDNQRLPPFAFFPFQ